MSAYLHFDQKTKNVQVQELVTYLDRLAGESAKDSARITEYKKLVEDSLIDEILNKLIGE